jgi:zinc transport system ATP-binding protein
LSGEITVSDGLKASEIGYLPQQTFVQKYFPASVKEIVLSGCQNHMGIKPFYGKEEKTLAEENMKKMGILELKDRCYRELSGGQQQRVLLARALCATKKLLLLDEPVAGLDPEVTGDMYETINSLNKNGLTIIMITHDINAAITYSSHILHIGEKVFYGTKGDYLMSAQGQRFAGKEADYA